MTWGTASTHIKVNFIFSLITFGLAVYSYNTTNWLSMGIVGSGIYRSCFLGFCSSLIDAMTTYMLVYTLAGAAGCVLLLIAVVILAMDLFGTSTKCKAGAGTTLETLGSLLYTAMVVMYILETTLFASSYGSSLFIGAGACGLGLLTAISNIVAFCGHKGQVQAGHVIQGAVV